MEDEPLPGEDYEDFFHRLLHIRMKSELKLRVPKAPRGYGLFEKGKLKAPDVGWRTCINQYLEANGFDQNCPQEITLWDGLQLEDGFIARPAKCTRKITRDSSVVRYQMEYGDDDVRSAFGQVQYFFSIPDGDTIHQLAYILHYPVKSEGSLLYRVKTGKSEIVPISGIQELAAVITCQKKQYLVTKESSLFAV